MLSEACMNVVRLGFTQRLKGERNREEDTFSKRKLEEGRGSEEQGETGRKQKGWGNGKRNGTENQVKGARGQQWGRTGICIGRGRGKEVEKGRRGEGNMGKEKGMRGAW